MALQVIVGYGPIGRAAAGLLAAQGHEVRVITRSGGPADHAAGPGGRRAGSRYRPRTRPPPVRACLRPRLWPAADGYWAAHHQTVLD